MIYTVSLHMWDSWQCFIGTTTDSWGCYGCPRIWGTWFTTTSALWVTSAWLNCNSDTQYFGLLETWICFCSSIARESASVLFVLMWCWIYWMYPSTWQMTGPGIVKESPVDFLDTDIFTSDKWHSYLMCPEYPCWIMAGNLYWLACFVAFLYFQ